MRSFVLLLISSSILLADYQTLFVGESIILNEGDLFETINYNGSGESEIVFTVDGRVHREGTASTNGANNVIIVGPGVVELQQGNGDASLGRLSFKITRSFELDASESTTIALPETVLSYSISSDQTVSSRYKVIVEGSNDKVTWSEVFSKIVGEGVAAFYRVSVGD